MKHISFPWFVILDLHYNKRFRVSFHVVTSDFEIQINQYTKQCFFLRTRKAASVLNREPLIIVKASLTHPAIHQPQLFMIRFTRHFRDEQLKFTRLYKFVE